MSNKQKLTLEIMRLPNMKINQITSFSNFSTTVAVGHEQVRPTKHTKDPNVNLQFNQPINWRSKF